MRHKHIRHEPSMAVDGRLRRVKYLSNPIPAEDMNYVQAAALSRFASPRCSPEVFLGPRQGRVTELVLRIRGYLFDREHEERYRSDVVERLHSAFAAERARLATAVDAAAAAAP